MRFRLFLMMVLAVNLAPPLAQAMEVQIFGRDPSSGETVIKTGDLGTPSGVFGGISPRAQQALTGQGIGPIFGSIQFPQASISLLKPELPSPPRQPSQVRSSLDWVPDNFSTRDGLNYGGITRGASAPGPVSPSPSTSSPNVNGNFTLDGTVGGGAKVTGNLTLDGKLTKAVMLSSPRLVPNPLPGTVGLFLTGLGAGLGAIRLLHRKRPIAS